MDALTEIMQTEQDNNVRLASTPAQRPPAMCVSVLTWLSSCHLHQEQSKSFLVTDRTLRDREASPRR